MVSLEDIEKAWILLKGIIRATPLVPSSSFSIPSKEIFLKLENLQRTGSFKIRGAYNKISKLEEKERRRGVIAASAGNHAQGVAYAASLLGIKATIVMPETTPLTKVVATKSYGANVILFGKTYDDCLEKVAQIQQERKMILIPGFDDEDVIAGQGTIAMEIWERLPQVTSVIIPVGGGGLISGISIGLKEKNPDIAIIGVQAKGAASMMLSRQKGCIVEVENPHTIADGIAIRKVGQKTFPIIQHYVDDIVLVEEESIARAILLFLEKEKIMVEGAGAVAMAALMEGKINIKGNKIALIISGGNIDMNMVDRIIAKGLSTSGRLLRIYLELEDIPGTLAKVTKIVAEKKANILNIYHDRFIKSLPLGLAKMEMDLETKGPDHGKEILRSLRKEGYHPKVMP